MFRFSEPTTFRVTFRNVSFVLLLADKRSRRSFRLVPSPPPPPRTPPTVSRPPNKNASPTGELWRLLQRGNVCDHGTMSSSVAAGRPAAEGNKVSTTTSVAASSAPTLEATWSVFLDASHCSATGHFTPGILNRSPGLRQRDRPISGGRGRSANLFAPPPNGMLSDWRPRAPREGYRDSTFRCGSLMKNEFPALRPGLPSSSRLSKLSPAFWTKTLCWAIKKSMGDSSPFTFNSLTTSSSAAHQLEISQHAAADGQSRPDNSTEY